MFHSKDFFFSIKKYNQEPKISGGIQWAKIELIFISSGKTSMIFLLAPNNFPFICNVLEQPYFILEPSDSSERLLAYTKQFSGFDANFPVAFSSPMTCSQGDAHIQSTV